MITTGSSLRVYTLPDCPKCDALKGWLKERGHEFNEAAFDTDAQLDFIMRNMFGNPPILEVGENALPSEELFQDESLDKVKLIEVLESAKA
jgi:glutaredoxin